MKLAINGALMIGTLDGANIEIQEEVGSENMYIFGLKADEIQGMRTDGSYNPWDYYGRSSSIKRVMDAIGSDIFCPEEPGLFRPVYEKLLNEGDYYFHLVDLESYICVQEKGAEEYKTSSIWARKAILNIARTGRFSSDRTISEYAKEIWNIKTVL